MTTTTETNLPQIVRTTIGELERLRAQLQRACDEFERSPSNLTQSKLAEVLDVAWRKFRSIHSNLDQRTSMYQPLEVRSAVSAVGIEPLSRIPANSETLKELVTHLQQMIPKLIRSLTNHQHLFN